jgi:hypothetical protein
VEAPNPKRLKRAGMDPDVSPCAVCGNEVSSDYKCVGACGRNLHHFCGKRLHPSEEDPRHGDPFLCQECVPPGPDDDSDSDSDREGTAAGGTAAGVKLKPPRLNGKKRKNVAVQEQFDVVPGEGSNEGKLKCTCKHCKEIVQNSKILNTSKLTDHLVLSCKSCPQQIKEKAAESTQRAKKEKQSNRLMPLSGKSLGQETLQDTRDAKAAAPSEAVPTPSKAGSTGPVFPSPPKSGNKHQTSMTQFGQAMTKESAELMQRFDLEKTLVRFEPLSVFDDPFHRASVLNKCPGLAPFLFTGRTALNVFTPIIDREVEEKINRITESCLGDINYSFDGVTVNGRSNLLLTRGVGTLTVFVGLVQLEDEVHVSATEATTMCHLIETDMVKLQGRSVASVRLKEVASVNVDNAAVSTAKQVCDMFELY